MDAAEMVRTSLNGDEKNEALVALLQDDEVDTFHVVFDAVTGGEIANSHRFMERLVDGLVAVYIGEGFPPEVAGKMLQNKLIERSSQLSGHPVELLGEHELSHVLSGLDEAQQSQSSPLTRQDIAALLYEAGYRQEDDDGVVKHDVYDQVWSAWSDVGTRP